MKVPNIHTSHPALPQIYAYSTPEIRRHDGWVKIGYTEKNDVEERIAAQCHTPDTLWHTEWSGNAVYENSHDTFRDYDFHAYLQKLGIERIPGKEWFHISGQESKLYFYDFRENRGVIKGSPTQTYTLRDSQKAAVDQTRTFFEQEEGKDFLWNAKPRFGKTLATYDLCMKMGFHTVLIVTNRPAIAKSWFDDYVKFVGPERYLFVSESDTLRKEANCLSRETYNLLIKQKAHVKDFIEFVSLQDLKGSIHFGGKFSKLEEEAALTWDLLVVDEAHEGIDTYKTDVAFDQIKRKHTLYLSGTPFKALQNEKFKSEAIFNWTYADERQARKDWDETQGTNPYAEMPQLNLYTYRMGDIVSDKVNRGIELNGTTKEYAFDLNEFFRVSKGHFVYDKQVDCFLDALVAQERFPFSTPELRAELKHTFWLLNRVDSVKKLAEKLRDTKRHPEFSHYEIIVVAGDGKTDKDEVVEDDKAITRVQNAIKLNDYTITLSVGQLTTGVTVPEWTGVFMLSNVKSPALYMQTAFRAQNPYLYKDKDGQYHRKENAYVFDFAPERTLTLYEQMANGLSSETASNRGDSDTRKRHIRELLNFFPVIGEDENGEMELLDAEKVLSIPRKLRSQEVVRRGFMSNFLFQNISNIFGCPDAVANILNKIQSWKEPPINSKQAEEVTVDDEGNAVADGNKINELQEGIFGEKIYKEIEEDFAEKLNEAVEKIHNSPDEAQIQLNNMLDETTVKLSSKVIEQASVYASSNGHPLTKRKAGSLRIETGKKVHEVAGHIVSKAQIELAKINKDCETKCKDKTTQEKRNIISEFQKQKLQVVEKTREQINRQLPALFSGCVEVASSAVVQQETEDKKQAAEEQVRDHLRGFARTIPSFLMAYGTSETTLENFERDIPEQVFLDVTSITKQEFILLRDGGEITNLKTGEKGYFKGNLFDSVVFNDSIKDFMSLQKKLANYFDSETTEDIFDYIPAQKNNQIFTPKKVVKEMVDLLEKENPGCFDNPQNTFADLYMKSGLYITEIVKRLYNSKGMKRSFPDSKERLRHIFMKQVYGLAPSEIIYKIATNYILGFDSKMRLTESNHHFRLADALPSATEGKLQDLVNKIFAC